jgi:SNF2 family DNA or RNA helicase
MTKIFLDDDVIVVDATWHAKELVKSIPGSRWDNITRRWTVKKSWASVIQLRAMFGADLEVDKSLSNWAWTEYNERIEPSNKLRELIEITDDLKHDSHNSKLFPFQQVDVEFMYRSGSCLIGNELGLGKTVSTLDTLRNLEHALPALVICPNSVKAGWAKQIPAWFPEATAYVLSGSALQRRKTLAAAKTDPSAVVVTNIESVRSFSRLAGFGSIRLAKCTQCDKHGTPGLTEAKCEVHSKELNSFGFKTVILDEAHRCKDPNAKQTRACWAVGHDESVTRRYALTGTPIANHIGDLWSIMHFIAPHEWPTKSKAIDRYSLQSWNAFGGLDVVGINPMHKEEFYKILDPRFRRVVKAQVLPQLPKKIRTVRWVEMGTKQAKAYKELEAQMATLLDSGEVLSTPNNLTKATRLLQLASSYADIKMLDELDQYGIPKMQVTLAEPSPKLDALEDILDELGDTPVIIAAMSRQLIELAAARFKKNRKHERIGLITGAQDEFERQQAIMQLNNGELRAVLMTAAAGGTGVDGLQYANTMIWLQRPWSLVDNVQAEGRIDRIGSERHNSIHMIDIIAQDTIEERTQWPRLAEKLERLEEINRDRAKIGHTTNAFDLEEMQILKSHLL